MYDFIFSPVSTLIALYNRKPAYFFRTSVSFQVSLSREWELKHNDCSFMQSTFFSFSLKYLISGRSDFVSHSFLHCRVFLRSTKNMEDTELR